MEAGSVSGYKKGSDGCVGRKSTEGGMFMANLCSPLPRAGAVQGDRTAETVRFVRFPEAAFASFFLKS